MARPIKSLWLFLLSVLGLSGGAAAATTAVLCNSDIQGESLFAAAPGCIDVLAWSWGLSLPPGGIGGSVGIQGFSVTKYIDSSSENLFAFVTNQIRLSDTVEFRDYVTCSTGCTSQTPYLTIHMKGTRVASQSMGGSGGEDRHTENVTFTFDQISYCYRPTTKGGTLGPAQCFAYDLPSKSPIAPF